MTIQQKPGVSRRAFLVGASTAGAAVTMGWGLLSPTSADVRSMISPTLFFDIHADESVVIHIQKAEVGQHVGTALAQIVADELEVDWKNVSIDYIGFDPRLGLHLTGGSWSINWTFDALSRAGASGRITMLEAAAEKFGGSPSDYTAKKGVITGNGHMVTYGALVASGITARSFSEEEMKAITLKTADQRHYVGTSLEALDIPAKSRGQAMYGIDAKVPGMVVATPLIPAVRNGARVVSVDDSEAKSVKGYHGYHVAEGDVIEHYYTGIVLAVADTYFAARKAAELIKVEYDVGPNAKLSLKDLRAENLRLIESGEAESHFLKEGDAEAAIANAESKVEAIYEVGVNLHGALEPQTCLVDIQDGVYHVYTGTQIQTFMVEDLKKLGIPQENIVVHQQLLGGSYGRRQYSDPHILAAMAAKQFGKPVKVIYSREFEQVMDYSRPVNAVKLTAGLNGGKIDGMRAANAGSYLIPILAPPFMAPDKTGKEGAPMHDPFAVNGLDHWYTVPNQTVVTSLNQVAQSALPPGAVRAVGPGYQYFALESFIDEIANEIGKDPLSLRLELLDGTGKNAGSGAQQDGAKRLAAVLREAVNRSGYGKPLPAGESIGIACSAPQERASAIWNACAAHVAVDAETGEFEVKKLTLVSEHGTLVNPQMTRDQLMGAALWGLAFAALEDVQFEDGRLIAESFQDMNPLRQEHLPELDLTVLDSGHYPVGVGEAGATVIAPAIANAIFKAVGARVRSLPITPEKVKAAMSA
ncbi:xanthine dehydrogenase family protein molybdopterin-binding subunit [Ruegeria marina]|uniref:Isoquinoline 1-oxidoreductase n=1 Tax=Ruegeria marina TaxID=639004 RepID=A0A1G6ZPH2_9RHOB|nr:molybdopterin cofactor-binding domain-containing protein [Ruegeria marina]SDE04392.1 isoquinoline 1-oxidoreductase [Ruegeria marina]